MKKYVLTSPKFNGQVTFGYDQGGDLVFYNNEIPDAAVVKFMKNFLPLDSAEFARFKGKIKHAVITEVPEDLTFERFWNAYDKKINRKRAEPIYEKLSDADRTMAIMRITSYQEYCQVKHRGVADPESTCGTGFLKLTG